MMIRVRRKTGTGKRRDVSSKTFYFTSELSHHSSVTRNTALRFFLIRVMVVVGPGSLFNNGSPSTEEKQLKYFEKLK